MHSDVFAAKLGVHMTPPSQFLEVSWTKAALRLLTAAAPPSLHIWRADGLKQQLLLTGTAPDVRLRPSEHRQPNDCGHNYRVLQLKIGDRSPEEGSWGGGCSSCWRGHLQELQPRSPIHLHLHVSHAPLGSECSSGSGRLWHSPAGIEGACLPSDAFMVVTTEQNSDYNKSGFSE